MVRETKLSSFARVYKSRKTHESFFVAKSLRLREAFSKVRSFSENWLSQHKGGIT